MANANTFKSISECLKNYFSELVFTCCMQMTYNLMLNVKSHENKSPLVLELGFAIWNEEEVHRGHARKHCLEL